MPSSIVAAPTDSPTIQLRSWKPGVALRPFVDHFGFRAMRLGDAQMYHPLPARNDCFLELYFEDRFRVVNVATGAIHKAPRAVLVGPHSRRREDIIHTGNLRVFHIGFTPIGFRALFGIPTREINNRAESADDVLGHGILELEQRLADAPVSAWRGLAETYLLERLYASRSAPGGALAAKLAHSLQAHPDALTVAEAAAACGRSVRQIERIFEDHVGLTPKLFSRIARLHSVLRLSQQEPLPDWASLAYSSGYFDQSHMVREFRALTGETPVQFRILQQAGRVDLSLKSEQDVAFVLSQSRRC